MRGLADVLPGIAATLGVAGGLGRSGPSGPDSVLGSGPSWPSARRAVVVLVDGLGHELLKRRRGHAPFLRSLAASTLGVPCGFPSTTATSMGTFGTGLSSGRHGLVGYEAFDPDRDLVFNELSWEQGPTPELWQPHRTLFEECVASGVPVTRIGPGFFDGSGLTRAALRGGRFVAADSLAARVDAAVSAATASARSLVYLYWGELDKIGHVHGCESWQWGDELESVDAALANLAARLPADCSLTVTADHGMVDCPLADRVDVATTPGLADGIRHLAGEPRSLQLHCAAGAVEDVRAAWTEILGHRADVLTRAECTAAGYFGRLDPRVEARIGDLVVLAQDRYAVEDSRIHRPQLRGLIGLHGSVSDDEVLVPIIHLPARRPGLG